MQLLEEKMYNKLEGYGIIQFHDKDDDSICVGLRNQIVSFSIVFY